jgi:hypothetical protein
MYLCRGKCPKEEEGGIVNCSIIYIYIYMYIHMSIYIFMQRKMPRGGEGRKS